MIPQVLPVRYFLNTRARRELPYGPAESAVLNARAHQEAFREISSWKGYSPTPLRELPGLARSLGLGAIWYKDEGSRLDLGSFKALGGAYGVFRVLRDALSAAGQGTVSSRDLRGGRHADLTAGITVTCASAGNHGKSVAMGARMFGCNAVIFLPGNTARSRAEGIRGLGARVVSVDGSYDDAVKKAAEAARDHDWHVVSDTAYLGYEEIPRHIMQGYTIMVREALEQAPSRPTHCFVQGGVGGLAAAVTAHLWEQAGPQGRPFIVVVEPAEADCLLESALKGRWTPSRGSLLTSMGCLACRNPSTLAWPILDRGADAFLTIPDYGAQEMTELLARGIAQDPAIGTQPSGAAGIAGLAATVFEPALSEPLGLGEDSRVLVFGSEGPREEPPRGEIP